MVNYDLNPQNIAIIERGRPKLNDFNIAKFTKWDPKRVATCRFQGRFHELWWRAPKEMQHYEHGYNSPPPFTEKVDIYALGNTLFSILTTYSPRGKIVSNLQDGVLPKVACEEVPELPLEFQEMTDPALVAIWNAMYKCLNTAPENRPSVGEIADESTRAADNLREGYGDRQKFYKSMGRGPDGQVKQNEDGSN